MRCSVKKRWKCRVCDAPNPQEFLRLPDMPWTDQFITRSEFGKEFIEDIPVHVCTRCWVVQTQHDVDVDQYYGAYLYSVGMSTFASNFMDTLAETILESYYPEGSGLKVLEIGSGDGEQLRHFQKRGHTVLGFEPSSALVGKAKEKGIDSIQGLFSEDSPDLLPSRFEQVDIVLLSYTLDHIPDPVLALRAIGKILDPKKGLLVVENHDVGKIFDRGEYCLFEHEHTIYLNPATAQACVERAGMTLVGLNPLPEDSVRANSLIFLAAPRESCHVGNGYSNPSSMLPMNIESYQSKGREVLRAGRRVERFIDETIAAGQTVAGYGAGGRGVMTLAPISNASQLLYLADRNPKGDDIYAPSSHVRVVPVSHMCEERADKIIVFSFGYMKEIIDDLAGFGYKAEQFVSLLDIIRGSTDAD